MDGAMWGPLRACSCLCRWSEGVGLVTRENHHGKLGGGEEQRAEKEAESGGESPRGRALGETTQPRFSPSTRSKRMQTLGLVGPIGQQMIPLFYLLVGGQ